MKRLNTPKTHAELTREIVRGQYDFSDGMRMVPDCEGLDVGDQTRNPRAVSFLNNCRGFKTHIEGDPGTRRFVSAQFAVTITNNHETYATSLASGELFVANGEVTLIDGDVFEVRGVGDFSGGTLAAVKGDYPRPFDNFKYDTELTPPFQYVGSSRVPAVEGFGDTSSTEITASKSGDVITRSSGPAFSSNLVGYYFVWDDGLRDVITEFVDSNNIKTAYSETSKSGSRCKIEPEIYGSYQHRTTQEWVILAGDRLYRSKGVPALGWEEIPLCSDIKLSRSMSEMREDDKNIILQNASGIFRIAFDQNVWCYKLNGGIPTVVPGDNVSGVPAPGYTSTYRSMYTLSLIAGFYPLSKNRLDSFAAHESPPAEIDVARGRDYGLTYLVGPLDGTRYANVEGCFYPDSARHFTHYTIYRTLDVGADGLNAGNNANLMLYSQDCPVAIGCRVTVLLSGMCTIHGVQLGPECERDHLCIQGGGTWQIVGLRTVGNDTVCELMPVNPAVDGESYNGAVFVNACAGIGGTQIFDVSISSKVLTTYSGRALTSTDEGKLLFIKDEYVLIKKVTSSSTAILAWGSDVASASAVIDPECRYPRIITTDQELTFRSQATKNASYEYRLQTRYYKALPNCNSFTIEGGWMVGAAGNDRVYHYCDMAKPQYAGYYKASVQYCNKLVAAIKQIVGYSGGIIIRCKNSTHKISLNVTTEVGDPDVGEQCTRLPDPVECDPIIGVQTQFDSVRFPRGGEIVFTSEPAIRFFDGEKYGEPYDTGRINRAIIRKLQRPIILSYVHRRGLLIWGVKNA